MEITVDREVLSEKLSEIIDIPFLPKSAERQLIKMVLDTAADVLAENVGRSVFLEEYGVTVTVV